MLKSSEIADQQAPTAYFGSYVEVTRAYNVPGFALERAHLCAPENPEIIREV
jgi:hypothetical protein